MKVIFSILLLTIAPFCQGQMVRQPISVTYTGLGAYSKKFVDVYSATSNQAALAQLKSGAFGVYGERRFMLEDLNGFSGIVALPVAYGTFGLQADFFGSSKAFSESQIGLIYARKLTEQVDIGVKMNYHSIRVPGYQSASAINFEGGVILHLTDKLHTGIHVYNPMSSKIGKSGNEKLASIYRFGLGYEASDKVFLSTEIVKQEDQQLGVNAGLQYNLYSRLFLRTGISTATNNSYVGLGLQMGVGRIDVNTAYHPQLGFTPGILLLINFKKGSEK